MTVDLPPAKDQPRLLVTDLLQTLQVFERARVEDLQDFLSGLLQDRCVQLRLPFCLHCVLLTIRRLRQKQPQLQLEFGKSKRKNNIHNM